MTNPRYDRGALVATVHPSDVNVPPIVLPSIVVMEPSDPTEVTIPQWCALADPYNITAPIFGVGREQSIRFGPYFPVGA